MFHGSRYFGIALAVVLGVVILGYAASKSINLIEGPELTILSPEDGATLHSPLLSIVGKAKNVAFLTLNSRQVYVDDTGNLFDQLLLYQGYNIITFTARDKFGREKTVTRQIIYQP